MKYIITIAAHGPTPAFVVDLVQHALAASTIQWDHPKTTTLGTKDGTVSVIWKSVTSTDDGDDSDEEVEL